MSELSKTQKVQEEEYGLPYHYIPQFKKDFSTAVYFGYGINYVSTIEFLLSKLNEISFSSICDVGCGDGRLVQEISERFPGRQVCGIDYSERAINLARGLNPSLKFIRADIVKETLKETFDVITLVEVFEHISPDSADHFVKALHGLLSENGVLMLTVPHLNRHLSKKHYQHFNSDSLRGYLDAFFSVEEELFFEKVGDWRIYFMRRLLQNKLFILNHRRTLNRIYRIYKNKCFLSEEKNCGRIYLKLRKK